MTERPTPEVDTAEMDALVVGIPGQQTTDKVVSSVFARQLERQRDEARERLLAAEAELEVIRGALDTKCYELGEALKRLSKFEAERSAAKATDREKP